jgi:hypothetical protein
VKGVKLSTQTSAPLGHGYLLQKLGQTMDSGGQPANAECIAVNQSSDSQISSILNEFERTKNINKELLLMRNIGSPNLSGNKLIHFLKN